MEDDFVYSTGEEDLRKKKKRDQTFSVRPAGIKNDGIIRVQREKKGRGGKTVFLVYGMPVPRAELKEPEKYMKLGRYFMKKHANENGKEVV